MGRIWWPPIIGIILAVTALSVVLIILIAMLGPKAFNIEPHPDDSPPLWETLVSAAPQSLAPKWSPDGSRILFTSLNTPESVWEDDDLYSITSDGSGLQLVSEDARWPSISPNGSRIAYSTTRDHQMLPYYIETSMLDGSDRRRLTEQALNDVSPAWSPDGSHIAFARFTRRGGEGRGIYLMDTDGSAQSQLFRFRVGVGAGDASKDVYRWGPVWSPDGNTLAFVVQEPSTSASQSTLHTTCERRESDLLCIDYTTSGHRNFLYTVGVDGSAVTQAYVTRPGWIRYEGAVYYRDQIIGAPAWSPDGGKLAFIRRSYDLSADKEPETSAETTLHTISPDGSGLSTVAEGFDFGSLGSVSWAPTGTYILFSSTDNVYVANTDDSSYSKVAEGLVRILVSRRFQDSGL